MRIHTRTCFFGLALLLTLLLAACAPGSTGTSNLTAQEVLQKSATTMKNLKSSHVDATANVQLNTTPATPTPGNSTPTPTTPSNVSFTVKASGVQQLPEKMQMDLDLGALNQNAKFSEVLTADKVYVKNAQNNTWYVADRKALENAGGSYFSGITIDTNSLLASLQTIKLTDHGDQNLNGQSLRHITADVDKATFKKLVSDNPQLKSYFGQQDINAFLDKVTSFSSTVDLWIDEQNFYLHQTQLKLNTTGDTSTLGQGAPGTITVKLDSTFNLSHFNEAVTVNPPANATPINNPNDLFGNQ